MFFRRKHDQRLCPRVSKVNITSIIRFRNRPAADVSALIFLYHSRGLQIQNRHSAVVGMLAGLEKLSQNAYTGAEVLQRCHFR